MTYRDSIKAFLQYAEDVEKVVDSSEELDDKYAIVFGLMREDEPIDVAWDEQGGPDEELENYARAVQAMAGMFKRVFLL